MFVFTVVPGKQFAPEELIDIDKLNLLGQPTILVEGDLGDLGNVSDTPAAPGDYLVWNGTEWAPSSGAVMIGATPTAPGVKGLVGAPAAGDQDKYWAGSAEWKTLPTTSAKDGADLYLATQYR